MNSVLTELLIAANSIHRRTLDRAWRLVMLPYWDHRLSYVWEE